MTKPENFKKLRPPKRMAHFDYREDYFPRNQFEIPKHPDDSSIMTFANHQVLRTLIRCQFSPVHTTGQRYVITGSTDGKVHIYDLLTGTTAQVLNIEQGFLDKKIYNE